APAPGEPRRLPRRGRVALGLEPAPRDVPLGIPAETLGLGVELADGRHLGHERERKAPLGEAALLRLIRAKQPVGSLALGGLAHPLSCPRGEAAGGVQCPGVSILRVTENDVPKVGMNAECFPGPPVTTTWMSSGLPTIGQSASSSSRSSHSGR